jgi:hypothetical protein
MYVHAASIKCLSELKWVRGFNCGESNQTINEIRPACGFQLGIRFVSLRVLSSYRSMSKWYVEWRAMMGSRFGSKEAVYGG